ncbi:MAG TPA: hypothetical protein VL133_09535 [Devosia sp.]|nr:hypothetical protein [Devosia sp.]
MTLRLAQSPEKRLETAPDRDGALKTKQGISLPEKVTHHPADLGQKALATGWLRKDGFRIGRSWIAAIVAENRICPRWHFTQAAAN